MQTKHVYSRVNKEKRAKSGASFAIHKKYKKSIKDWDYVNDRILRVGLNPYKRQLEIFVVYAPTEDFS